MTALIISFLTENYGFSGYFPDYSDSLRLSVNYYTGSRYPLFVGCFRGFCLYAGTYSGFFRDSSFYLRDHVRIIDTIRMRRSSLQEWAVLNRFFYSGRLLMGFEAGLVKEVYASVLNSYNDVFPDNRLSLGNERRGILFGGVVGYSFKQVSGYALFRYRNITQDSSISSGDTTGWAITVPSPPGSDLELLVNLRFRGLQFNLSHRKRTTAYLRTEGIFRRVVYAFNLGYDREIGPMVSGGLGMDVKGVRVMVGGAYMGGGILSVGARYPAQR